MSEQLGKPKDYRDTTMKPMSNNKKVKLSSTLAGQRELIREMWNRLSALEKGLENVEERTVKLEKRLGEHDYFHSKQKEKALLDAEETPKLHPEWKQKVEPDWCECKKPKDRLDLEDNTHYCGNCFKPIQPMATKEEKSGHSKKQSQEELREKIVQILRDARDEAETRVVNLRDVADKILVLIKE